MTPRALLECPQISSEVAATYNAFAMLSNSRAPSFSGIAAIQISEIKAYLDLVDERDVERRLVFVKQIQALDRAYREDRKEKTNSDK